MGEGGGSFLEIRYEVHPNHNQTITKQNSIVSGQGGARKIPLRSSSETCHQTNTKHTTHGKTAKINIETQLKHNAKQTPIKAGGGRAKVGTKARPKTTKQKQNRHRSSQAGEGVQTLTAGRATKTNKIAHLPVSSVGGGQPPRQHQLISDQHLLSMFSQTFLWIIVFKTFSIGRISSSIISKKSSAQEGVPR